MQENRKVRKKSNGERSQVANKIAQLAKTLLESPDPAAAIARVKKFGDFSTGEHTAVFENTFMKAAFTKWLPWRRLDNLYLAVAVARRVAEGEFESVSSKKAKEFIDENLVTEEMPYNELYKKSISLDELIIILKDLSKRQNYLSLLEKWASTEGHEDAFEEFSKVEDIEKMVKRKYGITSAALLSHIMDEYRRTSFPLEKQEIVRDVVKKHLGMFTRVKELEDD